MSSVFLKKIYFFDLALLILSFSLVFACFCAYIKLFKSLFCTFPGDRLYQKSASKRNNSCPKQVLQHRLVYVSRACRRCLGMLQIGNQDSHPHHCRQRQRDPQQKTRRPALNHPINLFHASTPFPVSLCKNERSFIVFKKNLRIQKRHPMPFYPISIISKCFCFVKE